MCNLNSIFVKAFFPKTKITYTPNDNTIWEYEKRVYYVCNMYILFNFPLRI